LRAPASLAVTLFGAGSSGGHVQGGLCGPRSSEVRSWKFVPGSSFLEVRSWKLFWMNELWAD
jgi:hypothetical protein